MRGFTNAKVKITAADLGLSGVMKFLGSTTTNISDGSTTSNILINGTTVAAQNGNVVLKDNKEFVWTGNAWEELGDESSHALKSITITGTGALGGGGTLENNRTITHNNGSKANLAEGLYKISTDAYSHIQTATAVSKSDITSLGIPGQDTTYGISNATTLGLVKSATTGTTSNRDYNVEVKNDGTMKVNVPWTDSNTWKANTKTSEGYVAKGEGQLNKLWRTDSNGIPGWGAPLYMQETTYANLVALRDNNNLIPGQQYRITDYQCTTTQFDTMSANHQFDIIVTADDINVLNENARAIVHNGDTYFGSNKLESWELKYCLDNDTTRFGWANSTNGKGVVYYMKDEFGNECPYDFKNIMFKRYRVTDDSRNGELADLDGQYLGHNGDAVGLIVDYNDYTWWYTFNFCNIGGDNIDSSTNIVRLGIDAYADSEVLRTRENIIKACYAKITVDNENVIYNKQVLNNITFNILEEVDSNFIGFITKENTVESECYNLSFNWSVGNHFGSYCHDILGDKLFLNNTFGNGCKGNTFGNNCYSNIFGNNCSFNTFGNYCHGNTFGNDCCYDHFGNGCKGNAFGNNCRANSFGDDCYYNTFGNYCHGNTFGNNCYSNIFGNYCYSNTLLNNSNNTNAQTSARWNKFENGVCYVTLLGSGTGSSSNYLQNITIRSGISGTSSARKTITETRNLQHDVTYRAAGAEDKII